MKHVFTLLAFALMSSTLAQVPGHVPADGLVAWYPFNGNALDESGNAANGTIHGATPTEDRNGVSSAAFHFDGQSWLSASPLGLPNGDASRSVSAWLNPSTVAGPFTLTAVAYGAPSTSSAFMVGLYNQGIAVQGWADDFGTEVDYSADEWMHVVCTFAASSIKIYLNGVLIEEGENTTWNTMDGPLILGSRVDLANSYFEGSIDDVGIWNRALHPAEVVALYNGVTSVPGCTDADACNYDPNANVSDDSCEFLSCVGCLNSLACNYDEDATQPGSCNFPNEGCEECVDGIVTAIDIDNDGVADCDELDGCTDPLSCNYNADVEEDDGSCDYPAYGQDCNGDCASGTAWYVDGNASELDATGEVVTPFATIQAAADVACEGDTILVAPGLYLENVSLTQSNVVLTGYTDSEVSEPIAEQVIIDGGELGTTMFISGEYTELAHVTIQNGRSGFGAGLYLEGSHHSWIHDCVIRDNVGTGDITAHGIQWGASHCVIEDCLVTGNYGRKHTINAGGSDNVIRNCRIVDNTAWETGGGIVAYTDRMLIENCLIANNDGGGITTYNDNTVVYHCTVTGNGGFGFFIWCLEDADMYVSNTVASGNGSTEVKILQTGNQVGTFHVRNSLIEGGVDYEWTSVYKVIDSDPSLLELSPNLTGDFTLSSISPAIGHGTDFRYDFDGLLEGEGSVEDLSGDARPQPAGTMPDLGCFEHPLGMPEPTFGCTDSSACNYEAGVTDDDGSCIFPTCDDITACNFDPDAVCGGGECIPSGCLEPEACNFNPNAECEGETCDYTCCPGPGCCDLPSVWDAAAQMCVVVESICGTNAVWNELLGECVGEIAPSSACGPGTYWDDEGQKCIILVPADTDFDGCVSMPDLLDLLTVFGTCVEVPWACGDPLEYQGYDYETIQIGEQCWFAENLRAEQYRDGSTIPKAETLDEWFAGYGVQCSFSFDEEISAERGLFYNGFAVNDERKLCPSGWHVPTDEEFMILEDLLGMPEDDIQSVYWRGTNEGAKLRTSSLLFDGYIGTDEVGFNGVPAGTLFADFGSLNYSLHLWSSTSTSQYYNVYRAVDASPGGIYRSSHIVSDGHSIRCIHDSE